MNPIIRHYFKIPLNYLASTMVVKFKKKDGG